MKNLNLTPEIVALLTKEATYYIKSSPYSIVPEEIHKNQLVKDFIACFEPADSNSEVFTRYNVSSVYLGCKLDRSSFLNEYWIDTEDKIIKVWAKNRASVIKYLKDVGYGYIHKIVLAKKFDKVAFINSLTS